jgi:ribosome recycling factor
MTEEGKMVLDVAKEDMEKAITHLKKEVIKLRTGKASPSMLSGIMVDYYGSKTPLEQVGNISTPEPRQLLIQPWEKAMIQPIIKEIQAANLGFNPQDDGDVIRIIVPDLTEERRKSIVKQAKHEGEEAKISIRNARKDANNSARDLKKEGLSEDEEKRLQEEVQKLTDDFIKRVEEIVEQKEADILSI